MSSEFRAKAPIVSNEEAYAVSPYLDTRLYVGFSPYIPQNEAGCLIEPPVSVPNAASHKPAATAAARAAA